MGNLLGSFPGGVSESTSKKLLVICRASPRSSKSSMVIVRGPVKVRALQMVSEPTHDCELHQWTREPYAVT